MAWTYGGDLTNSPRDALRALVDDINQDTPLLQDEVLDYLLAQNGSTYAAAAAACELLATRFAGDVDTSIGKVSVSYARRSEAYAARAIALRRRASQVNGAVFLSGGQSLSQKAQAASNPDAVQPAFSVGMNDYTTNPAQYLTWGRWR